MSLYVRELMHDLAGGRLDTITKLDLVTGLERLSQTNQIAPMHIHLLCLYFSGYSIAELALKHPQAQEYITSALALLEHETCYTDDILLQNLLRIHPKYNRIAESFRKKMQRLSNEL